MLNISSLHAVELTYYDSKKFRIEAGEPEALFGALNVLDIAVVVPTYCFQGIVISASNFKHQFLSGSFPMSNRGVITVD